jgi:hypothetical protein
VGLKKRFVRIKNVIAKKYTSGKLEIVTIRKAEKRTHLADQLYDM